MVYIKGLRDCVQGRTDCVQQSSSNEDRDPAHVCQHGSTSISTPGRDQVDP